MFQHKFVHQLASNQCTVVIHSDPSFVLYTCVYSSTCILVPIYLYSAINRVMLQTVDGVCVCREAS